jgi:hypothetical protein
LLVDTWLLVDTSYRRSCQDQLLRPVGIKVIFLMTYVLYFRRHWPADLLLSYVALNIGIFVTMSLLTQVRVDIAVGFGLFAILSIIRLRSSGPARSPSRRWRTTSSRW